MGISAPKTRDDPHCFFFFLRIFANEIDEPRAPDTVSLRWVASAAPKDATTSRPSPSTASTAAAIDHCTVRAPIDRYGGAAACCVAAPAVAAAVAAATD